MIVVTFRIILPWWWKPYLYTLQFFSDCGVLLVDPCIAADFIVRHIRLKRVPA